MLENIDKGLTAPKWVLINWPRLPPMPQNLSAQIVCVGPKVWDFDEKGWVSVVRVQNVLLLPKIKLEFQNIS